MRKFLQMPMTPIRRHRSCHFNIKYSSTRQIRKNITRVLYLNFIQDILSTFALQFSFGLLNVLKTAKKHPMPQMTSQSLVFVKIKHFDT